VDCPRLAAFAKRGHFGSQPFDDHFEYGELRVYAVGVVNGLEKRSSILTEKRTSAASFPLGAQDPTNAVLTSEIVQDDRNADLTR